MALKCEICGKDVHEGKSVVRRLNGKFHYCCSIRCEVTWEKLNLVGICG